MPSFQVVNVAIVHPDFLSRAIKEVEKGERQGGNNCPLKLGKGEEEECCEDLDCISTNELCSCCGLVT